MEITKEDFLDYEDVRKSGATNMFNVRKVCELSGLSRNEVLEIMERYAELKLKYLD